MSTYVITGTSKGIGLELVAQLVALASDKITHIFALSRSKPTSSLQSLIDNNAGRITHVTCAVDSDSSVQNAAEVITKLLGDKGLDVLVNNAGIGGASSTFKLEGHSAQQVGDMLNTNVTGVHRMIVAFLPLLRKGREKKIVNLCVSSVGYVIFGVLRRAVYND